MPTLTALALATAVNQTITTTTMKNTDKKQQAQFLYMAQGMTQKEIAETVGVSERTVYAWIHQYAWDKLRLASFQAPATIADNLCSQLVELQNSIAARQPGNRFPTPQEAEVSRKLVTSLEKMKKYPGLAQNMQVLETFRNYVRPLDKDLARNLGNYISKFLTAEGVSGYVPYQLEYGVAPISPFAPFMEESEEAEAPLAPPCPNINTCLHEGDCHYPDCTSLSKQKDQTAAFHIPPIHYARQWAEKAIAASLAAPEVTGSNSAIITKAPELLELPPASEETGSNSAISTIEDQHPEALSPEATGSNSAIEVKPTSVKSIDPCQSVILTNQNTSEETGSIPAIFVPENKLPEQPSKPEATGSNSAISTTAIEQPETPSVPEATGSISATAYDGKHASGTTTQTGNNWKNFRKINDSRGHYRDGRNRAA